MSKRKIIMSVVVASAWPMVARAEYGFITLSGTATEALTLRITYGGITFAPPACIDCFYQASVSHGSSALALRNSFIPEYGSGKLGAGNRRVTFSGKPALTVRNDYQYYVRVSPSTDYIFLEPGVPFTVAGITLEVVEPPFQAFITATGNVPAVSVWGLLILTLLILTGAKIPKLRRDRVAA